MKNTSKRDAELQAALSVFPTPQPEHVPEAPAGSFRRLLAALKEMSERARQRRELAELSEYALRDIGVSRAQVTAELSKPAWR